MVSGWWNIVFPDVLSISRALIEASSWSSEEQFERGVASRSLVHKRYSWDHVTLSGITSTINYPVNYCDPLS